MIDAYDRVPAKLFIKWGTSIQQRKRRDWAITQSGKTEWWKRYHQYIHGKCWKRFADSIRAERIICERCGKRGTTVHHFSYANLCHEKREDVQLLCYPCHKLMHPNKRI